MCLYSKTWIPKIATKDIQVYKIVLQKSDKLITPCLEYEVSKIMQTNFMECVKGILNISHIDNGYEISSGFIHSYKTLNAYFLCMWMNLSDPWSSCKILKGIIPKGSIYYEDRNTYCSNKLILDL